MTIVGHGASGALATLAALELADAGVPVAELVTFGAPRVGNKAFASHFEDSVAFPVHRVTHARDPVPHMPSAAAGKRPFNRRVGKLVVLDSRALVRSADWTHRHDAATRMAKSYS